MMSSNQFIFSCETVLFNTEKYDLTIIKVPIMNLICLISISHKGYGST